MHLLDHDLLRRAPKVLLHDHLDGGLRVQTVLDLAAATGHDLPTTDVDDLAAWFFQGGAGADLVAYLEAFGHTVAVMQTADALERIARECAEDLDADGVVYAEVRFAPELATAGDLTIPQVLEAIAAGFAAGPATIQLRQIVCGMRQGDRVAEAFAAAADARHLGVVGVDLAGPEVGFPAGRHAQALAAARDAGLHVTLHAGEADGLDSIADALDQGAERLGHGVRLVDDLTTDDDGDPVLGVVAGRVVAGNVTLEVCPTSNVHTGVVPTIADHPITRLRAAGLPVTLNTDNRLMSGVSATDECLTAVTDLGMDLDELETMALTAMEAAFLDDEVLRAALIERIQRGFAAVRP